jgi:hypothetical protein
MPLPLPCSGRAAAIDDDARRNGRVSLLDVLKSLLEEPDDVLIVEGVVDKPAGPAWPDEAMIAQQAQLMRDGGFAEADVSRDVRDAHLRARQGVEDADPCDVAEHTEGIGKSGGGRRSEDGAS